MTAQALESASWPWNALIIFLIGAAVRIALSYLFNEKDITVVRKRLSRELAEKVAAKVPETYDYIPTDAGAVRGLRQDELKKYTDSLEQLGFHQLADSALLGGGEAAPHAFGRCFVNEEIRCFAELIATQKTLDVSGPLIFGFSSSMENGWSVGSSSSDLLKVRYLRRLPRSLIQCEPQLSVEELLRYHVGLRDRVVTDLGVRVLEDTSLEGYRQRIQVRLREAREVFLKRDVLAEWDEATRIAQEGHWEWLGDYPEEAAQRKTGTNLRPLMELSPTYSVPQSNAVERIRAPEDSGSSEKSNK
jgi:hypothetical protein